VGAVQPGELFAWECFFGGASSAQYKNGVSIQSGVNTGAGLPANLFWGASATPSSYTEGDLCELIIINRALTAQERSDLQTWFNYQWKLNETQKTVMFISDSNFLTNGSADATTTVRSLLWETFKQSKVNGKWIHPIGNLRDGTYSGDRHQATAGIGIDALTTQLATVWSGGFIVPDIPIFLNGNADARNLAPAVYVPEPDASSTIDRYESMVAAAGAAGAGGTAIGCMSLKNFPPSETTGVINCADFNAALPGRITTLQGTYPQVAEIDLATDFPYNASFYAAGDEHWNEAGKAIAADLILTFLESNA
jgi:hypothetical protein